jgi:hypothetical protein
LPFLSFPFFILIQVERSLEAGIGSSHFIEIPPHSAPH